jgi:hypothetical protein
MTKDLYDRIDCIKFLWGTRNNRPNLTKNAFENLAIISVTDKHIVDLIWLSVMERQFERNRVVYVAKYDRLKAILLSTQSRFAVADLSHE